MTSATKSRPVKSFFLNIMALFMWTANVYLSLPLILQTHCFWAQNLQSHLTWRLFVKPVLSPYSTFVPHLPQTKLKTDVFMRCCRLVQSRTDTGASYPDLRCLRISGGDVSGYQRVGDGHHSKWTWVTDSVRGKRQEVSSSSDKICSNAEKIAKRKFLLKVGTSW